MSDSQRNRTLTDVLQQAIGAAAPAGVEHVRVNGVTADSRRVQRGWCFVAVRGAAADGHAYIASAIEHGATTIVVQSGQDANVPAGAVAIAVDDTPLALAKLTAEVSGLADVQRAGRLKAVGVTGTNGKSTTGYLLRTMLTNAGHRTALLGTIEYDLAGRVVPAPLTTPAAEDLANMLVEAADAGATFAVMETSSHALKQKRTDGVAFSVGVFTNLTQDHLDYHADAADYLAAKKRLFDHLPVGGAAIVNADDPASDAMVRDCAARVIRFGFERGDIHADIRTMTAAGSEITLHTPAGDINVALQLAGRHNVANAMAACGVGLAAGLSTEQIRTGLEALDRVPGRLEPVGDGDWPLRVLVDYAHTDDALHNVLRAVRDVAADAPVTVVFGCGGNRDRTKRPRMAAAAAAWADTIWVTSDNPRNETPEAIIDDIVQGFDADRRRAVHVLADRRAAIQAAIAAARENEIVVIAGKGHEPYQEIRGKRFPFDDRLIAAEALAARFGAMA